MTTTTGRTSRWMNVSPTPTDPARSGTAQDRVEWLAARGLIAASRAVPGGLVLCLARALGNLLWCILPGRRRIAVKNAARAGLDTRRTRSSVRRFCTAVIEALRLPEKPPRIAWTDPDALGPLLRQGRPFLVLTGHLGNWEAAAWAVQQRTAPGKPLHLIVAEPRNPLVGRFMNAHRTSWGVIPHGRDGSLRDVLRALQNGCPVGTAADQRPALGGVPVPFFGTRTAFPATLFNLAVRHDIPVVFIAAIRRKTDDFLVHTQMIWDGQTHPPAAETLLTRWVAVLENHIRRQPEQYVWMHDRWKNETR